MGVGVGGRIWITWETQRRSLELARKFGCRLFLFDFPGKTRYFKCVWYTIATLIREKPSIVFAQNPSMNLAFLVCLYNLLSGVPVVIDRHTTFMLGRKYKNSPSVLLFKVLHRLTIKMATLTIVTNQFLADIVEGSGGRAFVLPDKLPDLNPTEILPLEGDKKILMISSCAKDEPIAEVLDAIRLIDDESITLYITGNSNKLDRNIVERAPKNVVFTGFLPEHNFINYLFSVDCIMALTTSEYCMLCGCYEAVAVKKPLITSNKIVLVEYFSKAIFVDDSPKSIANGINFTFSNIDNIRIDIDSLGSIISNDWENRYNEIEIYIKKLEKNYH